VPIDKELVNVSTFDVSKQPDSTQKYVQILAEKREALLGTSSTLEDMLDYIEESLIKI
jgi:hypothetical protein